MSGMVWASLIVVGILATLLYRVWQRGVTGSDARPSSAAQSPVARAARRKIRGTSRSMSASRPPPPGLNHRQARKFHGVSIRLGLDPCKAVQALAGQRFLPDEAPVMPLAGCGQAKCECAYSHHGDRRTPDDRRSGWGTFGGFTPSITGGNRRAKRDDRRSSDP